MSLNAFLIFFKTRNNKIVVADMHTITFSQKMVVGFFTIHINAIFTIKVHYVRRFIKGDDLGMKHADCPEWQDHEIAFPSAYCSGTLCNNYLLT